MLIKGEQYQFDRIVRVLLVPFTSQTNEKGEMEYERSKDKSITILFDTQHEAQNAKDGSQYCTRIDFSVRQFGRVDATTIGRSIAKISIYNIESKIGQMLDAYNVYDENAQLTNQHVSWKINLQVGFNGMPLTTLFTGTINSFNKDRIQTKDAVDTVWNFYCNSLSQAKEISAFNDAMRALPGENYSQIEWGVGNMSLTYENAIKQIICSKKRAIKEIFNVGKYDTQEATYVSDTLAGIGFSRRFPQERENTLDILETYKEVNETNFDQYYKIIYASSVKGKENLELKKKWQTSITSGISVRGDNLEDALGQLAKKLDNCFAMIKIDPCETKQYILIFPAGGFKKGVTIGKEWTIHNFANLISEPSIDDSSLKLSFIMEPRMLVNDYIQLTIDDKIGRTGASFNLTSSGAYDTNMFTSTGWYGGVVGTASSYDKKSAAKYGNIFFKWYFIYDIEHSGSTHDATWQTTVVCNGKGKDNE